MADHVAVDVEDTKAADHWKCGMLAKLFWLEVSPDVFPQGLLMKSGFRVGFTACSASKKIAGVFPFPCRIPLGSRRLDSLKAAGKMCRRAARKHGSKSHTSKESNLVPDYTLVKLNVDLKHEPFQDSRPIYHNLSLCDQYSSREKR